MSLRVPVSLCKTKVNEVNLIVVVADTQQQISGLNVTVNLVMRVDIFDA